MVEILEQVWPDDTSNYDGLVYQCAGLTTNPARPHQTGGPLLYFGGYAPDALDLRAQHFDVYLMWLAPKETLAVRMQNVHRRAADKVRMLDHGLRVHVIVRDTGAEAKEYAEYIVSKLDDAYGRKIRGRALDASSLGVSHQSKTRDDADEFGYSELHLWARAGRARSGCGAARVGSADQVPSKIEGYQKMGIRASILSGYPHVDEAQCFGRLVISHRNTCSLPHVYERVPDAPPAPPLAAGERR